MVLCCAGELTTLISSSSGLFGIVSTAAGWLIVSNPQKHEIQAIHIPSGSVEQIDTAADELQRPAAAATGTSTSTSTGCGIREPMGACFDRSVMPGEEESVLFVAGRDGLHRLNINTGTHHARTRAVVLVIVRSCLPYSYFSISLDVVG